MTRNVTVGEPPAGYRLPTAARPGAVRLQVADLERSLAWYQGTLGLNATQHVATNGGAAATLTSRSSRTALIHLLERPGATPVPPGGRLGLYHYALLLPDRASLGAFLRHLAGRGERVGAADHLVSEALYLSDPDGLGIEVYADRPRATWQTNGREIAMGTLPLDANGLADAAGDTTWDGMPAGTTMGHVHLHVGDLRQADSFYRDGLGLDRVVWSYPGALFLSVGGYHHHLGLNTWAAGASPAHEGDARLVDWELLVPSREDVDGVAASLRNAGFQVTVAADVAAAADPWGTSVRVVARSARAAGDAGG